MKSLKCQIQLLKVHICHRHDVHKLSYSYRQYYDFVVDLFYQKRIEDPRIYNVKQASISIRLYSPKNAINGHVAILLNKYPHREHWLSRIDYIWIWFSVIRLTSVKVIGIITGQVLHCLAFNSQIQLVNPFHALMTFHVSQREISFLTRSNEIWCIFFYSLLVLVCWSNHSVV